MSGRHAAQSARRVFDLALIGCLLAWFGWILTQLVPDRMLMSVPSSLVARPIGVMSPHFVEITVTNNWPWKALPMSLGGEGCHNPLGDARSIVEPWTQQQLVIPLETSPLHALESPILCRWTTGNGSSGWISITVPQVPLVNGWPREARFTKSTSGSLSIEVNDIDRPRVGGANLLLESGECWSLLYDSVTGTVELDTADIEAVLGNEALLTVLDYGGTPIWAGPIRIGGTARLQ